MTIQDGIVRLACRNSTPGSSFLLGLRGPIARRTEEGATHLARWRPFRRFLCDFSNLKEAPPPEVVVWEIYMPYAVPLGVADRVIRQFPAASRTARPTSSRPGTPASRSTDRVSGGRSVCNDLPSLSRALARSFAVASSPRTSAIGGGGFSRAAVAAVEAARGEAAAPAAARGKSF